MNWVAGLCKIWFFRKTLNDSVLNFMSFIQDDKSSFFFFWKLKFRKFQNGPARQDPQAVIPLLNKLISVDGFKMVIYTMVYDFWHL